MTAARGGEFPHLHHAGSRGGWEPRKQGGPPGGWKGAATPPPSPTRVRGGESGPLPPPRTHSLNGVRPRRYDRGRSPHRPPRDAAMRPRLSVARLLAAIVA